MTDVYIAYAREDRERLRVLSDMLRFEGWDVWLDPSDAPDKAHVTDKRLASTGAVLAVWSDRARASEQVRSEAVTGLYKNKLIQIRMDGGAPPRPFDQLEVIDLAHWRGETEDPHWRRLTLALRRCAGEPTGTRPTPAPQEASPPRRAAPPQPQPQLRRSPPHQEPPPPPARSVASQQHERPAPPHHDRSAPPPPHQLHQASFSAPPPQPYELNKPAYAPAPAYNPAPAYKPLPPAYDPPPAYQPPPVYEPQPAYEPQALFDAPPTFAPPPKMTPRPASRPVQLADPAPAPISLDPHSPIVSSSYGAPRRSGGWAPVMAAAVLIASGLGLWFVDPFGWRAGGGEIEADPIALAARTVPDAKVANGEPATPVFEDTADSSSEWARVNKKSPEALRDFVAAYPRASVAETARSTLRVLDAQAWVTAVTADNEAGYRAYLNRFPEDGVMAGAMANAASDRLTAIGGERVQAIEEIQRGLAALNFYVGGVDGRGGEDTVRAAKAFATQARRSVPALATAAPRELRAFAEAVRGASARPVSSSAVTAANEADRMRVAQAEAASLAAAEAVTGSSGASADILALSQQARIAEANAWEQSDRSGTLAAYQSYLAAWPSGTHASEARAEVTRLNRPAPYSLDQLPAELRTAVDAARKTQASAMQKASSARQAATGAESLVDARSIVGAGGDKYDAQISDGAPNGLGIRTRGSGVNVGDRYRGELRNGQASGVGIYEYADNTGNANARALRYEGEHAADAASGFGVTYWRSGDSFAGLSGAGQVRGVLSYANGQRYEGEMLNGQRNGLGIVWSADGAVSQAGRWSRDQLSEPMKTGQ